jgi:hypothetical protein
MEISKSFAPAAMEKGVKPARIVGEKELPRVLVVAAAGKAVVAQVVAAEALSAQ